MRLLLDTNIIVSGLIAPGGPPAALIDAWDEDMFTLITSRYQLDELHRVFDYPHLKSRIRAEEVGNLLARIEKRAVLAEKLPSIALSPDPKDNPILATAIAGKADLIVTGDKRDILQLESVEGIPVVRALDALNRIRSI